MPAGREISEILPEVEMKEDKNYTPGEEFANALTHAVGAMLSIFGIVMLAVHSKSPMAAATALPASWWLPPTVTSRQSW